eukprot:1209450-Amorphochlora_amoeboformis.AAC.1
MAPLKRILSPLRGKDLSFSAPIRSCEHHTDVYQQTKRLVYSAITRPSNVLPVCGRSQSTLNLPGEANSSVVIFAVSLTA